MKKAGILMITLILVAAMFSGCRRRPQETTGTNMTTGTTATTQTTTQTTTRATMPQTTVTHPSTTGIMPEATDLLPDTTAGTDMGRGRMGPRY